MSRLLITAGTKIYIGPAKEFGSVDLVAGDFTSIASGSWTRIAGTTNLGTGVGDTSELVTSTRIDDARVRKGKGTRNAGSMELVLDLDLTDPGQIALVAAERSSDSFAFRIDFNDAPAGGTPSSRFLLAYVMSAAEQYDEANSVMKLAATLEIDSNIVRVAASAGG